MCERGFRIVCGCVGVCLCVCRYEDCVVMNALFILISLPLWTADWSASLSIAATSPLLVLPYPQIPPSCIIRHLFTLSHSSHNFYLRLFLSLSCCSDLLIWYYFSHAYFSFSPSLLSHISFSCLPLSLSHFLFISAHLSFLSAAWSQRVDDRAGKPPSPTLRKSIMWLNSS